MVKSCLKRTLTCIDNKKSKSFIDAFLNEKVEGVKWDELEDGIREEAD